jgi:hypothetical protein
VQTLVEASIGGVDERHSKKVHCDTFSGFGTGVKNYFYFSKFTFAAII